MKTADKIMAAAGLLASSLASLVKIPLMSRRPSPCVRQSRDTVIIMGNGPSLREAMAEHSGVLASYPLMAVNLSALAPEFRTLRPAYYILADIAFFLKEKSGNVPALWEALRGVDWPMTLFVPANARGMGELKALPANIEVKYFNLTPVEGYRWLAYPLYDLGLGMPRPRNVLVPAMMCAMREGFKRVVLAGADHNWAKTLWVTDRNRVVSVQPHFYKDDDAELRRAEEIFSQVHLHDVYENYAIAFRSYHNVAPYMKKRGVEILNATPGSFIDAFPRISLADLDDRSAGRSDVDAGRE